MVPKKVLAYLEKNKVAHEIIKHRPVFTAYDLAATLKEKMNKVAKTLLIKVGGKRYIIIVLPAHLKIDFKKLQKILKAEKIELAKRNLANKPKWQQALVLFAGIFSNFLLATFTIFLIKK